MKAHYKLIDGSHGVLDYSVIIPDQMTHIDGFTLIAFDSWKDMNDNKVISAVTNVTSFSLTKGVIGFDNSNKDDN